MPKTFAWLPQLYQLVAAGRTTKAIDLLFGKVDSLLCAGSFEEIDALLRTIEVDCLDTTLLVGVLSITVSAKNHLRDRAALAKRIEQRLKLLAPDRIDRLLTGLL